MSLGKQSNISVYGPVFLLSASVLCFEIVSTRIASVIFVQDYAFIILSLALLGIGSGGVFSYYRVGTAVDLRGVAGRAALALGVSLCIFAAAVTGLSITNQFAFLLLLFIPFFASGIAYAQIYRAFSTLSFALYASDLSGAAVGAIASLGLIGLLGAPNSVVFVAIAAFAVSAFFLHSRLTRGKRVSVYSILVLCVAALLLNGRHEFLGRVPIGNFPEKDFYHVYPDAPSTSRIIDSRWSIYGRADLVQYSHQDQVWQLFIDGAAGSQVYRFNGDIHHTQSNLQRLLLHHTNAIPFLCLTKAEKRSMLVIGPGGGKEVLVGLYGEADTITGVEVNPDFVDIVREHAGFAGGVYSQFPNVKIVVEEGRHFVRQSRGVFDLIVMALPSTAQMQNIEPFAASENFLLTKEAIEDYLQKLTPDGRLILTVHNPWELMRLTATAVAVFQDLGTAGDEVRNHFAAFEAEYAPTVVIKKNVFTADEALRWEETCKNLPRGLPRVSYLPYGMTDDVPSAMGRFLAEVSQSPDRLKEFISRSRYDISPCPDDRPYFYKIFTGIPGELLWLLVGTTAFNLLVVVLPFGFIRRKTLSAHLREVALPLTIFAFLGMGFMVLEVALFQKLVLYLGSPTISLSILLSSLLVGMGIGSYCGKSIYGAEAIRRLYIVSAVIVVVGILLFFVSPVILGKALERALPLRAATAFLMILPIAFLLGIPFPSCIQVLAEGQKDRYIPWMYGINGSMSVLGSVLAVILSMLFGFTATYFVGLLFYLGVSVVSFSLARKFNLSSPVVPSKHGVTLASHP
ncbi:MAG: spermine synthase [Bacteroidetes bacterium]|nr:spermine synthase [Bacteroidota bacterium]